MKEKTDRRTLYTINIIKDTFLQLLQTQSYLKITVSELCWKADITRSTFYLHFNSINDVLNRVLDDALLLTQNVNPISIPDSNFSFDYLNENESLIPACQRIGDSSKYQKLLMDPDLSEYIIGRIMKHERNNIIPLLTKKIGLSQEDAETLFCYIIHGSFAVNRAHHFIKDEKWFHDVKLLNKFVKAGYLSLKKQN